MLKGILFGITLASLTVSLVFTTLGFASILNENVLTGAVIGAKQLTSYASIFFAASLIATFVFLKKFKKDLNYN